jgi:hypothetical protein
MAPRPETRTEDLRQALALLSDELSSLVEDRPASPPGEQQVWPIYSGMEKTVAKLKLRLGVERPGVFQEVPTSKTPELLLTLALERMKGGIQKMDERHLLESLESLREARNYLRGYLSEKHKVKMREKRQAALARRSSASPS